MPSQIHGDPHLWPRDPATPLSACALLSTPEPGMALMRSNARWLTDAITTAGDVAFPAHLSAHPMH